VWIQREIQGSQDKGKRRTEHIYSSDLKRWMRSLTKGVQYKKPICIDSGLPRRREKLRSLFDNRRIYPHLTHQ